MIRSRFYDGLELYSMFPRNSHESSKLTLLLTEVSLLFCGNIVGFSGKNVGMKKYFTMNFDYVSDKMFMKRLKRWVKRGNALSDYKAKERYRRYYLRHRDEIRQKRRDRYYLFGK